MTNSHTNCVGHEKAGNLLKSFSVTQWNKIWKEKGCIMQKVVLNREAMWGKSPWVIKLKCFQEKHECLKRRGN